MSPIDPLAAASNPANVNPAVSEKPKPHLSPRSLTPPIAAAVVSWMAISVGFLGLKMLMRERPEFVGQPLRVTQAELVQESPQILARKVTDDISVIKSLQPELSEVQFDMRGRRDYRGLRTMLDMSGTFRARYLLTNAFEEPVFVLFKCPHPRTESGASQGLLAAGLRLQTPASGLQESMRNAWLWSGQIQPHQSVPVELSYQVGSLKGVTYRVTESNGNPVRQHRVVFRRQDIDSIRFESGEGPIPAPAQSVTWERRDFLAPDSFIATIVESRNLYTALSQLLEIGPLVSLLFLLAVAAVILARQSLTALQMFTIAAGYAFYFPLVLYLSSRFSFPVALLIAVAVPGALLVNYGRWLLGGVLGWMGGPLFLALYQVFPTLAAFAGWNRGMVLLCLGVVTLWVLINLQNQALRRKAVTTALAGTLLFPAGALGAQVQLLLPADLGQRLVPPSELKTNALCAFQPAKYIIRHQPTHFQITAQLPFDVIRPSEIPVPLFGVPVHFEQFNIESATPNLARVVTLTNRLALFTQQPGAGLLQIFYRTPIELRDGKNQAVLPVLSTSAGQIQIESPRNDLQFANGGLWAKSVRDQSTVYDLGVTGQDQLTVEWRGQDDAALASAGAATAGREFYGIGLTRVQNLTVISSDGSCTHFAEFELPVFLTNEFRLRLPLQSRLISVSINGNEISAPALIDQVCRVRLPTRETRQQSHRVSFRIAYPAVRLGFVGLAELTLPELYQTAGTLEWIVALPNGFQTQVISSGLEIQKSTPDLVQFGDYGRILRNQPLIALIKNLAPPGAVNLTLKYRQTIPGLTDSATN